MIYYLDTNALYSIRKIQKEKLPYFFTSIMAILELVSGINEKNFDKRRTILSMVKASGLTIDHAFPEEIIANSFDIFDEYDFVEERDKGLLNLVDAVIASEAFSSYQLSEAFNAELGHEYFKFIDQNLSKNFAAASINGIKLIKHFQRNPSIENVIDINGVEFDLNTVDGLRKAFPMFSKASTLEAMCHLVVKMSQASLEIADVFSSYNHLADVYVKVYSSYAEAQILNSMQPSKNDAQDLLHLLYLKSDFKRFIISDDKIFSKYFRDNTLPPQTIFG